MEYRSEKQQMKSEISDSRIKVSLEEESLVFKKPFFLLTITLISIFWIEVFIMLLLLTLSPLSLIQEVFIDASLLTLLVFPMLYFLLIRPLQAKIKENEMLEEDIRKLKSELSKYKK
jgi:hypothetical protein